MFKDRAYLELISSINLQDYHNRYNNPVANIFCLNEKYRKTIKLLMKQETNFDTLLSIGKILYFLGDYDSALNYVQNAIELNIMNKNSSPQMIFAYDWLSRIAYKEKRYTVAANFYEKIIDKIISDSDSILANGIIHQKPKLSDMVRYLNETKDLVAKGEIHYINKTIWEAIKVFKSKGWI